MFTEKSFDGISLEKYLVDMYDFTRKVFLKNTLIGFIDDIKVDLITHDYPYVGDPLATSDGIRLYDIKDIAAMKISAIADAGTRLKDFVDIACLSTKLSLSDMLKAYDQKYKNSNLMIAIRALTYFEDINFNEPIQMIEGKYEWGKIEERLRDMLKRENDVFPALPLKL